MHRGFILGTSFVWLGLISSLAYGEPSFETSLSQSKITLDETVVFTLEVAWSKSEASYTFAFPKLMTSNLEIIRQGESQETFLRNGEAWTRKTFIIELKGETLGEGMVQAFNLPYIDPSLQKGGSFSVAEQRMQISQPPRVLYTQLVWIAGGLVILASSILGFLSLRHRRRHVPPPPEPSLEDKTVDRLKTLESSSESNAKDTLFEMGREFHVFVSSHYGMYFDRGSHAQIIQDLKRKDYPRDEMVRLENLLNRLEESKFMGKSLSETELKNLQKDIIRYVESKRVVGPAS